MVLQQLALLCLLGTEGCHVLNLFCQSAKSTMKFWVHQAMHSITLDGPQNFPPPFQRPLQNFVLRNLLLQNFQDMNPPPPCTLLFSASQK